MGVADLLSPQRIELNLPLQDKQAVLERLVKLEGYGEAILDLEAFRRDMMARGSSGGNGGGGRCGGAPRQICSGTLSQSCGCHLERRN